MHIFDKTKKSMPFFNNNKKFDYIFLLCVLAISLFGLAMITSASMVVSMENYSNNYHYLIRQLIAFVVGLVLLFTASQIDYRIWRKNAVWFLGIALVLLLLVLVPGIGHKLGGARRWIGIGTWTFQPTEFIKLSLIIYLAAWLEKRAENIKTFFSGFLPFAVLLGLIIFLIMSQPDLGTTLVVVGVAATMFFVAGASLLHILFGMGILGIIVFILIKAAPYRMQRFLVFLNPGVDTQGSSYHLNQALLAIGSGGLWGLGFGGSRQKYLYLPMPHTDSIFAVIAEELGFIRTSFFLFVFLFLIFRGYQIARGAPDNFARFLAVGITSWILIQTIVNIGSMLNLIPMTGVPLPFVSYGGSSLVMLLAACGIMLNISKSTGKESAK